MSCYQPIPAHRSQNGGPWQLNPQLGTADTTIPCGKCLGCRTDRATDWTNRCIHEARQHTFNRFVTLTYDDEHLPRELKPEHLQKFLKRLRKHAETNEQIIHNKKTNIRYLACGEYGETTSRPHYHLNIFNIKLDDEREYKKTDKGTLYTSKIIDDIWGQGAAKLSAFSGATAGYVASYLIKKGTKDNYADENGEHRHKPFLRASNRPAIGRTWIEKYKTDVQHGYMIINEKKNRIPRYYLKRLEITDPQLKEAIQYEQIKNSQFTAFTELSSKHQNRLNAKHLTHAHNVRNKHRQGEDK